MDNPAEIFGKWLRMMDARWRRTCAFDKVVQGDYGPVKIRLDRNGIRIHAGPNPRAGGGAVAFTMMAAALLSGEVKPYAEDVRRFVKEKVEEEEEARIREDLKRGLTDLFLHRLKIDLAEESLTEDR